MGKQKRKAENNPISKHSNAKKTKADKIRSRSVSQERSMDTDKQKINTDNADGVLTRSNSQRNNFPEAISSQSSDANNNAQLNYLLQPAHCSNKTPERMPTNTLKYKVGSINKRKLKEALAYGRKVEDEYRGVSIDDVRISISNKEAKEFKEGAETESDSEGSQNDSSSSDDSEDSPSDTTIYAPALLKSPEKDKDVMIDKIANFVEEIRIQQRSTPELDRQTIIPSRKTATEVKEKEREQSESTPRSLPAKLILEAEQYKQPTGKEPSQIDSQESSSVKVSDDEFFHLICHIDSQLKEKIQKGKYVDLEKL